MLSNEVYSWFPTWAFGWTTLRWWWMVCTTAWSWAAQHNPWQFDSEPPVGDPFFWPLHSVSSIYDGVSIANQKNVDGGTCHLYTIHFFGYLESFQVGWHHTSQVGVWICRATASQLLRVWRSLGAEGVWLWIQTSQQRIFRYIHRCWDDNKRSFHCVVLMWVT